LIHVPARHVPDHWERVKTGLQRVIARGGVTWSVGDVFCALGAENAFLALIDDDGFLIWQRYPGDDGLGMLFVWVLEGKNLGGQRAPVEQALLSLARHVKARTIRIIGRKGWGRSPFWSPAGYVYEHEVT